MSKLLAALARCLGSKRHSPPKPPATPEPAAAPPVEPERMRPDPRHNPVLWGIITGSSNRS